MSNRDKRRKARAARQLEEMRKAKCAQETLDQQLKADADAQRLNSIDATNEQREKSLENPDQTDDKSAGDSGGPLVREIRAVLKAVNWQGKNRFAVEKTVSEDGALIAPLDDECDVSDEILTTTMMAMRHKNARVRMAGVRAGIQMVKAVQADDHKKLTAEVQADDHKKLTAEVRPTQDNRRVMLIIPDNGRDAVVAQKLSE